MQDGIYHVTFASNQNSLGEGLAVVKAGTVNGGDDGYLYIGTLRAQASGLAGQLTVKRWKQGGQSVFGNVDQFGLTLTGSSTVGGFEAFGNVTGQPDAKISIKGRLIADAA